MDNIQSLPTLSRPRPWRKGLIALTIVWIALYVPATLVLLQQGVLLRSLAWLVRLPWWAFPVPVLHTLVVCAGWGAVAYQTWKNRRQPVDEKHLAQSIEDLIHMAPADFEAYVAHVFRHHGFKVWDIRYASDHGVDLQLIAPNGTAAIAQVKRYRKRVGEPTVRDLYGTMLHAGAEHAYLINPAGFSRPAQKWAADKPITLIDGRQMLALHAGQITFGPELLS